jgi:hypothetical protein
MEINNNYNINFGAKFGPNLKTTLLKKEFGGDKSRLKKFEDTFQKVVEECLEENTVLEMTPKGRFELSHPAFPKYKIPFRLIAKDVNLLEKILKTHPLNYRYNENTLFKTIISKEVKRGISPDHLSNIATEKFAPTEAREYFFDFIRHAKRIKAENPQSGLTDLEFSEMSNRELQELLADESNGIMARLQEIKH